MPRYCCVNVHASLLPRYRGAAPIQWAVINGDPVTGVTTQRMDEGLDTGDIIMEEEVNVRADETAGTLFDRLAEVGASLCVRTMEAIEAGTAQYTPQDHAAATHTAKIKKELGDIDWSDDAAHIECLIRGLDPWPSAYTSLSGRTLKIWRAEVVATASAGTTVSAGTICGVEKNRILVQTGNGILGITEVQPEGKKRMVVSSFLNGNPVAVGTKFERVTV
jgi:methionyl-tRNA formyltransferase